MIHFGIGTMRMGSTYFGILQDVSVDFDFEEATLYGGDALYPKDVRIHTGSIEGSAAFADIDSEAIAALLGGTTIADTTTITDQSQPTYYETVIQTTTDGINLIITLKRCKSSKLALAFNRTAHVIPNFDFYCYADDDGNVATIQTGDAS